MNRDKARELLEKELRIRPTVKASAIFTGKNGSMGFRAGRFYAVTIVKRKGEVVLIAPDDGLKCPYSSLDTMLNNWHMEHSIKAIHEKEQAAAGGGGGTSPEDKERITKLEDELEDLSGAIERGLTT